MFQRGLQALVKFGLEPEWEARFEPNSYGFRPGRCAQDAIEAIFIGINRRPKYALYADVKTCFDRIDHRALLAKLKTIQPIQPMERLVRNWLKAGIMDEGEMIFPEAGTPQGGVSPLLANVALRDSRSGNTGWENSARLPTGANQGSRHSSNPASKPKSVTS